MARDVIADVLLALAVLVVASASVGVLVMRDAYQKLHYVTPAALVAPALVAAAVFVQAGLYENTGETLVALRSWSSPGRTCRTPRSGPSGSGRRATGGRTGKAGRRRERRNNDPGRQLPRTPSRPGSWTRCRSPS